MASTPSAAAPSLSLSYEQASSARPRLIPVLSICLHRALYRLSCQLIQEPAPAPPSPLRYLASSAPSRSASGTSPVSRPLSEVIDSPSLLLMHVLSLLPSWRAVVAFYFLPRAPAASLHSPSLLPSFPLSTRAALPRSFHFHPRPRHLSNLGAAGPVIRSANPIATSASGRQRAFPWLSRPLISRGRQPCLAPNKAPDICLFSVLVLHTKNAAAVFSTGSAPCRSFITCFHLFLRHLLPPRFAFLVLGLGLVLGSTPPRAESYLAFPFLLASPS